MADHLLYGSYDYRLVALSVLISVFASYAALDLAGRVTSAHANARRLWLGGGAVAMGTGNHPPLRLIIFGIVGLS